MSKWLFERGLRMSALLERGGQMPEDTEIKKGGKKQVPAGKVYEGMYEACICGIHYGKADHRELWTDQADLLSEFSG